MWRDDFRTPYLRFHRLGRSRGLEAQRITQRLPDPAAPMGVNPIRTHTELPPGQEASGPRVPLVMLIIAASGVVAISSQGFRLILPPADISGDWVWGVRYPLGPWRVRSHCRPAPLDKERQGRQGRVGRSCPWISPESHHHHGPSRAGGVSRQPAGFNRWPTEARPAPHPPGISVELRSSRGGFIFLRFPRRPGRKGRRQGAVGRGPVVPAPLVTAPSQPKARPSEVGHQPPPQRFSWSSWPPFFLS